jgi:hypothetical protein
LYEELIKQPRELDMFGPNKDVYWDIVNRTDREALFDKAEIINESASNEIHETIRQIELAQPTTIGDLAVLANAAVTTNHELWEVPVKDLDWDVQFFVCSSIPS